MYVCIMYVIHILLSLHIVKPSPPTLVIEVLDSKESGLGGAGPNMAREFFNVTEIRVECHGPVDEDSSLGDLDRRFPSSQGCQLPKGSLLFDEETYAAPSRTQPDNMPV